MALPVAFNLWNLRAQVANVQQLNDNSIHASMVRWAAGRISAGHLPFDGWYPFLSLGSSRFHHYQSLPHIITAYLSVALGPWVFRWSLYIMLAFWPLVVYLGARLIELDPWQAATAALVAPLLSSGTYPKGPGLGYEYGSYTWRGSGAWTQLWGMWALPIAWGVSWRAVAKDRSLALAALAVGLTIALHLLTGYLAVLSVGVWILVRPSDLRERWWRAAAVVFGALAVSAFMLVPLLSDRAWAIQDEFSRGTYYYDSFGARRILSWLVRGDIFDAGRLPIITAVVGVGLVVAISQWGKNESVRVVVGAGLLSLLLFFGRPTLGPTLKFLPGGSDIFWRRYISGVHLAGIYLVGIGGSWLVATSVWAVRRAGLRRRPVLAWTLVGVAGMSLLIPAVLERARFETQDALWIAQQVEADKTQGADFSSLVALAEHAGDGRVFAGLRANSPLRIGAVPAYAALLNSDADGIGFTRPTWSTMSPSEYRFDPTNPAHYDLFGVRYVIGPAGIQPVSSAVLISTRGGFSLWAVPSSGYLNVVDTIAPVSADRSDLGDQMASILSSGLIAKGQLPTVGFGSFKAAKPTLGANQDPSTPPGTVIAQAAYPSEGVFSGQVHLDRGAVVLLKASFDPRWTATVDGVAVTPQMIAPGLVGVPAGPGSHAIVLVYKPYPHYAVLFLIGIAVLVSFVVVDLRVGYRGSHAVQARESTRVRPAA